MGMKYVGDDDVLSGGRSEVNMLEYYAYRCRCKKDETNPYLCFNQLSQQSYLHANDAFFYS
jgi:hypothetical protein